MVEVVNVSTGRTQGQEFNERVGVEKDSDFFVLCLIIMLRTTHITIVYIEELGSILPAISRRT